MYSVRRMQSSILLVDIASNWSDELAILAFGAAYYRGGLTTGAVIVVESSTSGARGAAEGAGEAAAAL